MSLTFKPKTESELAAQMLAQLGEYDFEVLTSEAMTSKKGNPMIKVKLGIYRGEAMGNHVFDYLLAEMEAKLRHFCDSTGLLAKYESGELTAEDCVGRAGKVKLVIDDKDAAYPPKNVVKDYVARAAKPLPVKSAKSEPASDVADDDVPF